MSNQIFLRLPERLLTPKEVEKITGRAKHTLAVDRIKGIGIPFVKVGVNVMYTPFDVSEY
jgi:hypothetical protein